MFRIGFRQRVTDKKRKSGNGTGMKGKPISVAVLLQDLEFGGTQRYALHLLRHMNREIFSPELWILRGGDDMLPLAEEAGIRVVRFSNDSWVTPRALLGLFRRLTDQPPSILYTLTVVPNIWGRVFGKMAGVPVLISGYRSVFPKQFERWLWRFSSRIICNAEALKEIMIRRHGVAPARIAVIPNAVDTERFRPAPLERSSNPTVVYVGRLVPEKDPLNLVRGFHVAAERVPEAVFQMVGNGPLKEDVRRFVQEHGFASRLRLVSGTDDIRPYLRSAWVFALASRQEASANVVIEAMAAGLPVVATRVGGIPEVVQHGETGILVEPGNAGRFGDALTELLLDEPKRREMGRKAREWALANHSLEEMTRRTENVLLEAVRECRSLGRNPTDLSSLT